MSQVMVIVDGSATSKPSVRLANLLSRALDGPVELVTRIDSGKSTDIGIRLAHAEHYLAEAAAWLEPKGKPRTRVVTGELVAELRRVAAHTPETIVVVGLRRHRGATSLIGRALADRILRDAGLPVALVTIRSRLPHVRLDGVLVPLDGSTLAETALPLATQLARHSETAVQLLRVADPNARRPSPAVDPAVVNTGDDSLHETKAEARAAEAYLEWVAAQLLPAVHVERYVRVGRLEREIVAATREYQVSLVVMAVAGRQGLRRLLGERLAMQVAQDSEVPLVLCPPAWHALPWSTLSDDAGGDSAGAP